MCIHSQTRLIFGSSNHSVRWFHLTYCLIFMLTCCASALFPGLWKPSVRFRMNWCWVLSAKYFARTTTFIAPKRNEHKYYNMEHTSTHTHTHKQTPGSIWCNCLFIRRSCSICFWWAKQDRHPVFFSSTLPTSSSPPSSLSLPILTIIFEALKRKTITIITMQIVIKENAQSTPMRKREREKRKSIETRRFSLLFE